MMFIATVDTRNFSFMAAGNTEEEAIDALRSGWNVHAAETGATIPADEIVEDAQVVRIDAGTCILGGEFVLHTEGGE